MNGEVLVFFHNSSSVCSDFQYLGTLNGSEAHQSPVMFGNQQCLMHFLVKSQGIKVGDRVKMTTNQEIIFLKKVLQNVFK